MKHDFIEFWRLYAPLTEFKNRYYACEKLWNKMDERRQLLIVRGLVQENKHTCSIIRKKNPYFFLVDWKGPNPHWLSPAETDYYYYALNPATGEHHFSKTLKDHQNFLNSLG